MRAMSPTAIDRRTLRNRRPPPCPLRRGARSGARVTVLFGHLRPRARSRRRVPFMLTIATALLLAASPSIPNQKVLLSSERVLADKTGDVEVRRITYRSDGL